MADYSKYADVSMPVTVEDHIMTIKFNRPDRRNAIGPGMHEALEEILTTVNNDEDVRVIVITGEGDKAFCAGADVRGLQATKASGTRPPGNTLRGAKWLIHHFLNVEVPMVAAINGDAVGLGATLALMCDITVMADTARIGDTHVKVGIVAGDGGPLMWPFLIGMNRAKEALMTGRLHPRRRVRPHRPRQQGHLAARMSPEAMRLARELAAGAPLAVKWTKASLNQQIWQQVINTHHFSVAVEDISFATEDHAEGTRSFTEKRPPKFMGR